jgi:RNA polymerase sigma factor (sigma-70 family)
MYALECRPSMEFPDQSRATVRATEEVRAVQARLSGRVRVRFALTLDCLASRIAELARPDPTGASLDAFVDRLVVDDLYLATACASGDEQAWSEFGSRFFAFLHDFARRLLREPNASDVADQVIADLWRRGKIAQYEGRSSLKTWLGATVAHAAINAAKQNRARAIRALAFDHASQSDTQRVVEPIVGEDAGGRLARWVSAAIRALPSADQLLILLYYEQNLTLAEMSAILHLSKAALSRRLDRTRRDLRRHIETLATQSTGATSDATRASVDLGRVELDLSAVFGTARSKGRNFV